MVFINPWCGDLHHAASQAIHIHAASQDIKACCSVRHGKVLWFDTGFHCACDLDLLPSYVPTCLVFVTPFLKVHRHQSGFALCSLH